MSMDGRYKDNAGAVVDMSMDGRYKDNAGAVVEEQLPKDLTTGVGKCYGKLLCYIQTSNICFLLTLHLCATMV